MFPKHFGTPIFVLTFWELNLNRLESFSFLEHRSNDSIFCSYIYHRLIYPWKLIITRDILTYQGNWLYDLNAFLWLFLSINKSKKKLQIGFKRWTRTQCCQIPYKLGVFYKTWFELKCWMDNISHVIFINYYFCFKCL